MRVLVLSGNFPNPLKRYAGIFVLEQISALRSIGIEVMPVAPSPWSPRLLSFDSRVRKYATLPHRSNTREFEVDHPRVLILPITWPLFQSGLIYYLCCRKLIGEHVRNNQIDIIHAHTSVPDGFAAVLLGREFRVPVVCTVHGSDINEYPGRSTAARLATRWALARVHRLIAVSEHLKANVFRLVGKRQIQVVPNGADDSLFKVGDKYESRRTLGIPLAQKVIVFVGRLAKVKAIPILLGALGRIQDIPFHLYLVGDGELRTELSGMVEAFGLPGRCTFVGDRPHEEVAEWLRAADCLTLPSTMEGLPTIIPEAMMCGTPIVASRVGGIPEIVVDHEDGLLIPPGDPFALSEAIRSVITDENLQMRLARQAATKAHNKFTWKLNAEKTATIYQDAIDSYRRGFVSEAAYVGDGRQS